MKTSLTQLLVHFDASPRAVQRLEYARLVAQPFAAATTALYAAAPIFMDLPFVPPVIDPGVVYSPYDHYDDGQMARARASFDQWLSSSDARVSWADIHDVPVVPAFAQQALYADLMVLGQHEPSGTQPVHVPADFADAVMAVSGKPALIVPYAVVPATVGETIVIAWKETREAARAVAAAMPLLQNARQVHVVSWADVDPRIDGDRLDLNSYLKLSGVQATWHYQGKETDNLGELLLSRVFDLRADLLVMGCYGHSRAREWVLGGTSRTLLQSMTLPVLMAQ